MGTLRGTGTGPSLLDPHVGLPGFQSSGEPVSRPSRARCQVSSSLPTSATCGVESTSSPAASSSRAVSPLFANQSGPCENAAYSPGPMNAPSGSTSASPEDDDICQPPMSAPASPELYSSTHSSAPPESLPGGLVSISLMTISAHAGAAQSRASAAHAGHSIMAVLAEFCFKVLPSNGRAAPVGPDPAAAAPGGTS